MIPVNMMDDLLYNGDCNCSVIDFISYLKWDYVCPIRFRTAGLSSLCLSDKAGW